MPSQVDAKGRVSTANDAPTLIADSLIACRTLEDRTARLACFDREVAQLAVARERDDLIVVDREEIRRARRSVFGFNLPNVELFSRSDGGRDGSQPEELTSTIAAVEAFGYSAWQWQLADQSVWQTVDAPKRAGYVKRGDAITIKPATLGGYRARIRGDMIAVRRVR